MKAVIVFSSVNTKSYGNKKYMRGAKKRGRVDLVVRELPLPPLLKSEVLTSGIIIYLGVGTRFTYVICTNSHVGT